jgi:hypothetical protein
MPPSQNLSPVPHRHGRNTQRPCRNHEQNPGVLLSTTPNATKTTTNTNYNPKKHQTTQTHTNRRTQIAREEESDNERPRSAGLGRGGGLGAQGKWRRSQYCCRVRVGKFKLTKSYFFQLPLRRYHSPSYNCPTSQKQIFNENST